MTLTSPGGKLLQVIDLARGKTPPDTTNPLPIQFTSFEKEVSVEIPVQRSPEIVSSTATTGLTWGVSLLLPSPGPTACSRARRNPTARSGDAAARSPASAPRKRSRGSQSATAPLRGSPENGGFRNHHPKGPSTVWPKCSTVSHGPLERRRRD